MATGLVAASCTSSRPPARDVSANSTAPAEPEAASASTGSASPGTTPTPAPVGGSHPGGVAGQPSAAPAAAPGSTQAPQPSVPSQLLPTIFSASDTGPFAPYAEEYRRFEDAYRTYRGKPVRRDLADTLFWKWLEDRHLANLLEKCGRDCTRNRLVAPLVSGSFSALDPACAFDFGRGRAAGYRASAFEAAPAEGGPIWVETSRCADRF